MQKALYLIGCLIIFHTTSTYAAAAKSNQKDQNEKSQRIATAKKPKPCVNVNTALHSEHDFPHHVDCPTPEGYESEPYKIYPGHKIFIKKVE